VALLYVVCDSWVPVPENAPEMLEIVPPPTQNAVSTIPGPSDVPSIVAVWVTVAALVNAAAALPTAGSEHAAGPPIE
jgi:hypothetical protein